MKRHPKILQHCKQCDKGFLVRFCVVSKGRGLFCTDKCMRTYNHDHRMTRTEIWRRYNQSERGKIKQAIWHRIKAHSHNIIKDDSRCESCSMTDKLVTHHIDGNNGRNGKTLNNARDNLVVLCRRCHPRFHSRWGLKEVMPYGV